MADRLQAQALMLDRLKTSLAAVRLDPGQISLGAWLALTNVAIVLLVVTGISVSAIGMLRNLADEQGQARVQLAGAMAREELRRFGEDTLTQARSLAERPALVRGVNARRPDALPPLLRRACETDGLDACAIFAGPVLVTQTGVEQLPWDEVLQALDEQGERFLAAPGAGFPALLGAAAPIGNDPGTRVLVVRLLDDKLAQRLVERVGLDVEFLSYSAFTEAPANPFTQLHSAGLSDGRSAVRRIGALDLYAASIPVFAVTGEAIALIEVHLPAQEIDSSVGRLVRQLLVTALILATVAVLAGFLLGQRVAGPVGNLTRAATRLGEGDFSTSIPPGGAAEVGVLSRTMEDMRRNLVELTGELRRREAEAQAVLKGVVEGVYAVDKSRQIVYLNPQAARLLGVDPQEVIGRFCGDVLKPCAENGQRPCETRCPILQARSEGSAQAVERLELGGGSPRTAVITSAASVDGLQVQVIRDETELEAVRRARDSTLANISHEFRTPLAAQLASIELLRAGLNTMSPDQREELVLSLERGTLRLTRLIDNLLESVRIESGQLGIRRQSIVIADVIEDAKGLIESLLLQRRQPLEVNLPEDLPTIDGDGSRLTQVFVNLLANSSKFAPEGSPLRIGARQDGEHVAVWVEDEGPGLPDVESGSIFDRFHRGTGDEPEPGGLGLGLWIAKSIVERHGGEIVAERTPENRTRFTIRLPVAAG